MGKETFYEHIFNELWEEIYQNLLKLQSEIEQFLRESKLEELELEILCKMTYKLEKLGLEIFYTRKKIDEKINQVITYLEE